jgi:hypothetical protein
MLMMKLFCAQQDREHVGELDPHAGVDVFGSRLYDNVDLMRRTPKRSTLLSAHAMMRVTRPPRRPIIVLSSSEDMPINLVR